MAKIVDMEDKVIVKEIASEPAAVQDGRVMIQIYLSNISCENYKLQISELVGSKKADQSHVLQGDWEREFTR